MQFLVHPSPQNRILNAFFEGSSPLFLRMRFFRFYLLLISAGFISSCGVKKSVSTHSTVSVTKKYSELLGVDEKNISNLKLYNFIDEWYGAPYQYGGKSKSGVDCSGFTSILFKEVYEKNISGSSSSIYNQCEKISKSDLREGDLVFFKIETKDVSHIGIYLQNNKFVHASTKAGVMIDDLAEDYYKKYFEGGGKVK